MTYSKYDGFWLRITDIISASLFGRAFLWIVRTIGGMFHSSWIYSFFTSKDMEDYAASSKIAGFFRRVIFKSKFSDMVAQSAIVRSLCFFPDYLFSSRISLVSFYLIPSGILDVYQLFRKCRVYDRLCSCHSNRHDTSEL